MTRPYALALAAGLFLACGKSERAQPESQDLSLVPPADTSAAVASPEELRQPPAEATPAPAPRQTLPAPPPARPVARPAAEPEREATPPPPPPPPPAPLVAPAGAELVTASTVEITSRRNKAGETFTAEVKEPVRDDRGREVIPSGAVLTFTIVDIKEAENRDAPGTLVLRPTSVVIGGDRYDVRGEVTDLQYSLQGRGVTAGDAGKVAAGAAAGAIVGRILGRRTSGAVVGGAVGAAAGTAIAIQSADRDVVVPAGSRIVIRLTEPLSRAP